MSEVGSPFQDLPMWPLALSAVVAFFLGVLVARVGRKEEWPGWTPTEGEKKRLGPLPNYVEGGAHNPMGARGIYLFSGNQDTLFRIHGTNQPQYIGQAISSGCIRLTNEDVIDLYNRVKMGAIVVVLGPRGSENRVASAATGRPD